MNDTDKRKLEQDMDKILKRHGNTLRKFREKYGEDEFNKMLMKLVEKDTENK